MLATTILCVRCIHSPKSQTCRKTLVPVYGPYKHFKPLHYKSYLKHQCWIANRSMCIHLPIFCSSQHISKYEILQNCLVVSPIIWSCKKIYEEISGQCESEKGVMFGTCVCVMQEYVKWEKEAREREAEKVH